MSPSVRLRDLIDTLDLPSEWSAWVDRETGTIVILDPETRAAGEEGDQEAAGDGMDERAWAAALAIASGVPRYVAVPDAFDFHEYRHMERFVAGQEDERVAEQLWRAIKGRGAFRQFKDTARHLGRLDEWFAYREQAAERHLLAWAEVNGIAVDRTPRG